MTCEVCEQQPRGRKAAPIACMRMDPNKPPVSARFMGEALTIHTTSARSANMNGCTKTVVMAMAGSRED